MKQITVLVQFNGDISVQVPEHLSEIDATLLATKVALARILATTENPDAPEEDAYDEYHDRCDAKQTSEADWDSCQIDGVGGVWENK